MGELIDLTGKKINRWTVIERVEQSTISRRQTKWLCKCDCGILRKVDAFTLRKGISKSCGCLSVEVAKKILTVHGKTKTSINNIYLSMKARCLNVNIKSYPRYGGRGITVCERWLGEKGFINFLADMGERPSKEYSLDRKDNNKGYNPDNCRWATKIEQANNCSSNRLITIKGQTKTASEWCMFYGIKYSAVMQRINKLKWDYEKAFNTPVVFGRNQFSKS